MTDCDCDILVTTFGTIILGGCVTKTIVGIEQRDTLVIHFGTVLLGGCVINIRYDIR